MSLGREPTWQASGDECWTASFCAAPVPILIANTEHVDIPNGTLQDELENVVAVLDRVVAIIMFFYIGYHC